MNRALDGAISEHVFDEPVCTTRGCECKLPNLFAYGDDQNGQWFEVAPFSEDWSAMEIVVKQMEEDGFFCLIDTKAKGCLFFEGHDRHKAFDGPSLGNLWVVANSVPEAVCLAALKANGVDPEDYR